MKDYITTYSKIHFTVLEPKEEDILLVDIAHALSMMTRANGHYSKFYSVAQHSICCALEALERDYPIDLVIACLLHDASEAYLCDVTRPVKKHMDYYLQVEETLQNAIYKKFIGFVPDQQQTELIKEIDDAVLFSEFRYFMKEELQMEHSPLKTRPVYVTKSPEDVEEEFLDIFRKLRTIQESVE